MKTARDLSLEKQKEMILEQFNFYQVRLAMNSLNWEYAGEGVPTVNSLRETAERLLDSVIEHAPEDDSVMYKCCTGGFEACVWYNDVIPTLDLKFVLESGVIHLEDVVDGYVSR